MSKSSFGEHVHHRIRNDFPGRMGWRMEVRSSSQPSMGRTFYRVSRIKGMVVISAIEKRTLFHSDVDEIIDYRGEQDVKERSTHVSGRYDRTGAIIYIPNDTSISHTIKRYADIYGVEIRRTQWSNKSQQGYIS